MISYFFNLLFDSNRWQETGVILINLRTTFHTHCLQAVFNHMQIYDKIFKWDAHLICDSAESATPPLTLMSIHSFWFSSFAVSVSRKGILFLWQCILTSSRLWDDAIASWKTSAATPRSQKCWAAMRTSFLDWHPMGQMRTSSNEPTSRWPLSTARLTTYTVKATVILMVSSPTWSATPHGQQPTHGQEKHMVSSPTCTAKLSSKDLTAAYRWRTTFLFLLTTEWKSDSVKIQNLSAFLLILNKNWSNSAIWGIIVICNNRLSLSIISFLLILKDVIWKPISLHYITSSGNCNRAIIS